MRYLIMHKNDAKTEAGIPPPMELVHQMGAFIGEYARTGRFIDGAGLAGSKTRSRVSCRGNQCTTQHGPYRGERELPAELHLLKVSSREEAVTWAERYGKALGNAELEVGKVTEPWDIGLMPAPANPPLHMLLIEKTDATAESAGRTPQQKTALAGLKAEMKKAGVLMRSTRLQPSATAKRLVFTNNNLRVMDGPFVESKELIGGFAVMDLAGTDEAIAMCQRYAEILGGTLEIDLRLVETAAD